MIYNIVSWTVVKVFNNIITENIIELKSDIILVANSFEIRLFSKSMLIKQNYIYC